MRTALVHYWLVRHRGGENVFEALMDMYPEADVFTNVYSRSGMGAMFEGRAEPVTTWVGRLPMAAKAYPIYAPLMPSALESLDMGPYDLVISSESGPAKWVIPGPNARHICYVHSPMRYLWDQRFTYRERVPWPLRPLFDGVTGRMRRDDVISSTRVDDFVANSSFVAARIERYYRRKAQVIHPPVAVRDVPTPHAPEDYYLFAGQLVSYKRVDLALQACHQLKRRLVVVGDGSDAALVKNFQSPYVEYRGRPPREELLRLMSRCRALLFPGVEDFGIIPVEVMACGRPVIGYAKGGILDSVVQRRTGLLYDDGSLDGMVRAIRDFETWERDFQVDDAIAQAATFSPEAFQLRWRSLLLREPLS